MFDFGGCSDESTAEDDADVDVAIDIRKLLSSSSQAGANGPNLSRQLMTYLRLLQADLQHLKVRRGRQKLHHALLMYDEVHIELRWKCSSYAPNILHILVRGVLICSGVFVMHKFWFKSSRPFNCRPVRSWCVQSGIKPSSKPTNQQSYRYLHPSK